MWRGAVGGKGCICACAAGEVVRKDGCLLLGARQLFGLAFRLRSIARAAADHLEQPWGGCKRCAKCGAARRAARGAFRATRPATEEGGCVSYGGEKGFGLACRLRSIDRAAAHGLKQLLDKCKPGATYSVGRGAAKGAFGACAAGEGLLWRGENAEFEPVEHKMQQEASAATHTNMPEAASKPQPRRGHACAWPTHAWRAVVE